MPAAANTSIRRVLVLLLDASVDCMGVVWVNTRKNECLSRRRRPREAHRARVLLSQLRRSALPFPCSLVLLLVLLEKGVMDAGVLALHLVPLLEVQIAARYVAAVEHATTPDASCLYH